MARVITIGNRKGGTGKTTTSVAVAAGLAHRGRRVLLLDLDPQAHATLSLGVRGDPSGGVFALLSDGRPASELVVATYLKTLHLLPGTRRLTEFERLATPLKEARLRLRDAVRAVAPSYDYVLFDTPPTLGLLTVSALIASDELVIPMQAHFLALDGLAEMVRMVATVNRLYGTRLVIRGIIPTFYQERVRLSRAVMEDIRAHLGAGVLLHPVRTSIGLAEAPGHGKTIYAYDPKCTGALDYLAVVAELDGNGGARATRPEPLAQGCIPPAPELLRGGEHHGEEG
jgi:chromosome partitioning protein